MTNRARQCISHIAFKKQIALLIYFTNILNCVLPKLTFKFSQYSHFPLPPKPYFYELIHVNGTTDWISVKAFMHATVLLLKLLFRCMNAL